MNVKNKKVLIIEDEKVLQNTYCRILKSKFNYEIDLAGSAETGLEFFSKKNYDFIITDLDLPGMNGIELIKKIKSKKPEIKIIVISGYGFSTLIEKAIKYGAEEFLSKPVDIHKFRNTVAKYI